MRRIVLLAAVLALAGCEGVGSLFEGPDVPPVHSSPRPTSGSGQTMRGIDGADLTAAQPLPLPQPGDFVPGMVAPYTLPPPNVPGSPAQAVQPSEPALLEAPRSGAIMTTHGFAPTYTGGNGITTFTATGGGVGLVVPNANGTSTLIGPNGTIGTAPRIN